MLAQLMQHTAKAAQRKQAEQTCTPKLDNDQKFPHKAGIIRTRFQVTFRAWRSSVYSLVMASLQPVRNYSFKILVMQDTISLMGSTVQAPLLSSKYDWPGARKEQTVVGQNMLVTPHSFRKNRVEVQEGQITRHRAQEPLVPSLSP